MKTLLKTTFEKPNPINAERISTLIHKMKIDPKIASIDLEMVKMKISLEDEGEGWSKEKCDEIEIEYKRFLHLNILFKKEAIVPTKEIDIMWHYHLLDTRAYHKDCEIVFGGYFHHFPYFGLRGNEDKKNLEISFIKTTEYYKQTYGENMIKGEHTDCWHDCQGRCWHACSNDDNLH